jgi:four helix bundle protein
MAAIRNFRDLEVWQLAKAVAKDVYLITRNFPPEERYGMSQQIGKAAVSISSNIAEGHARGSRKEYIQFLVIARGSLAEVESQLEVSIEIGFVSRERVADLFIKTERLSKMLRALIQALKAPNPQSPIPNPPFEPA